MIKLYTTHCPKCQVLRKKLDMKNINYEIEDNVEKMLELNIETAPMLQVDENLMDFNTAVKWINNN